MDRGLHSMYKYLFYKCKNALESASNRFWSMYKLVKSVAPSASANNQILMHVESCKICGSFALAKGFSLILANLGDVLPIH